MKRLFKNFNSNMMSDLEEQVNKFINEEESRELINIEVFKDSSLYIACIIYSEGDKVLNE